MTLGFAAMLSRRWEASNSLLCVGLDPDPSRFPAGYSRDVDGLEWFLTDIVEATAEHACAFKPQIAYFAALGAEAQLERLCTRIRADHPGIPIILDAKRGDIGDTARMYAREAFERYGAHAVTVNPYMGTDTIEPYLTHPDGAAIVLCRTSNPGSGDFQSRLVEGEALYAHVARTAATTWATMGDVSLVVGATYPEELSVVREIVGDMTLLVPGVGAQGGDPHDVVRRGRNAAGTGLVVNSSRAILYAGGGIAGAAREAARTKDALNAAR
jgi:orotidine-5'-phosphate decarboxylase